MTIIDRIESIKTQPLRNLNKLGKRDIGCDYMGSYIGGCQRASWYKYHQFPQTNPLPDRLTVAGHIHETITETYIDRIVNLVAHNNEYASAYTPYKTFRWTPPIFNGNLSLEIDCIYKDAGQLVGILFFTGSGYGFRSEIFGSKGKEGRPKLDHLVQCWTILTLCPLPLERLEMVYVDRDKCDDICFTINETSLTKEILQEFSTIVIQGTIPACSYNKQWKPEDVETIARMFANKEISKAKYETWKDSGIGGDWQCEYCPFLNGCKKDEET